MITCAKRGRLTLLGATSYINVTGYSIFYNNFSMSDTFTPFSVTFPKIPNYISWHYK